MYTYGQRDRKIVYQVSVIREVNIDWNAMYENDDVHSCVSNRIRGAVRRYEQKRKWDEMLVMAVRNEVQGKDVWATIFLSKKKRNKQTRETERSDTAATSALAHWCVSTFINML